VYAFRSVHADEPGALSVLGVLGTAEGDEGEAAGFSSVPGVTGETANVDLDDLAGSLDAVERHGAQHGAVAVAAAGCAGSTGVAVETPEPRHGVGAGLGCLNRAGDSDSACLEVLIVGVAGDRV